MTAPVLLLSARPPFVDEWHDLPATTARVSALLPAEHEIAWSLDEAIPLLPSAKLLVTNVTAGLADPTAAWDAAITTFSRRGGSVLALHSSSIAFAESPIWAATLGATWVQGRSGHPPIGDALIEVDPGHPVTDDLLNFTLHDERYVDLSFAPTVRVLASHLEDGVQHPLVTVRELDGGGHAVYSALGHGVESYDSPDHQTLLRQAVRWLLS